MYRPFTLIVLAAAFTMAGCTFTSTMPKQPVFAGPKDSLQAALNRLVICERWNLNGTETTTNGKKQSDLEVDVINGKSISDTVEALLPLAKAIGLAVKMALKDPGEYDHFSIRFVTQKRNGSMPVSYSNTIGFKSADLQ